MLAEPTGGVFWVNRGYHRSDGGDLFGDVTALYAELLEQLAAWDARPVTEGCRAGESTPWRCDGTRGRRRCADGVAQPDVPRRSGRAAGRRVCFDGYRDDAAA